MKTLLLITGLFILNNVQGQNIIAVQHNGNSSFFTDINVALSNSVNGDTVYLPGGSFTISNVIDKSVHIVGAGSFIDSSMATGITTINGNIVIKSGADNGSIEGVSFASTSGNLYPSINFGNSTYTSPISNFSIIRCKLINGLDFQAPCSLFSIFQNIIGSFRCSSCSDYSLRGTITNSTVNNNHITGQLSQTNNNNFKNNNFYYLSGTIPTSSIIFVSGCTFENNIFQSLGSPSNCIFNNNIGVSNSFSSGNSGTNNITESFSNSFINPGTASGNGIYYFSIYYNYNLKVTSLGNNAGTDGTDIGVYGGIFPWKDGMIPFNPHFQFKNILGTTDSNGNLPVNIKVKGQ